jgi:hypothetical protein
MSEISFGSKLNLKQAAQLVMAVPENRFLILGEMGTGKSAMLEYFREHPSMSDYLIADPIDAQTLDLGDTAMPVVDKERMVTNYAPNARFKISEAIAQNRPVIIMIDEFGKAMAPVQNMLHPLLEVRARLGDLYLPEGSIVYATSNLAGEGVGDNFKMHTNNRMTRVEVAKPTGEEWIEWGVMTGRIDPVVLAFAAAFPQLFASFMDEGQNENPYIGNPRHVQFSFWSGRSGERASNIVRKRHLFDEASLVAALKGTIGEAAARDMQAFIAYQDQLPKWVDIVNDPKRTMVPTSPGACSVLIFGAIQKVDSKSIDPFMEYMERLEPEWQAAFAINVAKNVAKQAVAFGSKKFAGWLLVNEDLL